MQVDSVMRFARYAPAPPKVAKYTARYFCSSARVAASRFPLPIIPFTPILKMPSVKGSIRDDVVGPAEPMTLPGGAGLGPM